MIPEFRTARLLLRLVSATDLEQVHALHSLPETDEFNTLGIPANAEETRGIINTWIHEYTAKPAVGYAFIIEHRGTKEFIGLIGLRMGKPAYNMAEAWYKLHVTHWGYGYATEALKAIIEFGFGELRLHRIEAGCATANTGSVRVMEKAGMLREGTRRKVLPLKSGWADNYIYGILAGEQIWY